MYDPSDRRAERGWNVTRQALISLVVVGVVVAFFAAKIGAAVVALSLGALVATQVAISLAHYRRVMRREWPAVEPRGDDEDDW